MGGWVGGWDVTWEVGGCFCCGFPPGFEEEEGNVVMERRIEALVWVGGWMGGWVEEEKESVLYWYRWVEEKETD